MTDSNTSLKNCSSLDLANSGRAVLKSLTRPEEQEVVSEMIERLIQYAQLNTGAIHFERKAGQTQHERHVAQIQKSIDFFVHMSNVLTVCGFLTWNRPLSEETKALVDTVNEMRAYPVRLISVICEIYARGGVKFNHLALPDEVRKQVEAILKETGQLR